METFLKGFLLLSAIILTLPSAASGQLTQLRFSVLEEQSPFTYVGNVAEASNIQANRSQNEIARLRYQILTQVNPNTALFVINQFTGRLETAMVLDREDLCQSLPQCILDIDVAVFMQDEANPNQLTELIVAFQVNVELRDMNDNSPTFPEQTITVEFPESSSIGFEVLTSTARDDDGGDLNSVQTYEFLNSDDTFDLKVLTNTDGSEFLAIVLNKTLDREEKGDYQVTIIARDGGNPSRTGSVNVNILVGDANDNRPVFLNNPYNVTFPENQPVESVVLTVSATDSDEGDNAHITYKFGSSSRSELFSINSTSGEISLRSALDYEISQQREFSIVVEAEDGGDPSRTSQVLVNVKLHDVNDNAPQININLPPGGVDVSEDADSGYYIANVFVYDIDSGENGTVTCSVENDKFTLVKFSKDIYKINLQSSLDREQAEKHNVTVICSDEGVPRMTNRTFFTINVKDVNDNSPVFGQTRYNVSIEENNSVGDVVFTILANDNDAGDNGRVTYQLLDRRDYFSINSDTGVITTNVVFDRENITSVFFRVTASDNGDVSLRFTSTANVTVSIRDENDETPQFNSDSYIFNVLENQPLSSIIGNVSAYDKDIGSNGDFTFSIEDGYTRFYDIDDDGKIRARISLDRESRQEYSFKIYVTDKGVPRRSGSATVTVNVMDENDNVPVIFYPGSDNNSLRLKLDTFSGKVIATVVANDSDHGANSRLTYSIIQGNSKSMFKIDNKTGQITLVKPLTENDSGTYTLVLAVQDGGVPQRTTWTNLVVVIGDKADAKNLIIVISVCSVTLFISIGLIITICIIRRHDNQKCNERRVHFEKGDKNLCWKWLKCLSAPTTQTNYINTVARVKDSNKLANRGQGHCVDTKPIISNSRESFMYDSLEIKHQYPAKPELTRSDSGVAELSGGSTSPPQSNSGDINDNTLAEVDLASSYPVNFTFVDNNMNMTAHAQTESRTSLNNTVYDDRQRMPPPHPYQRYVSMDEDYLRNPQKRKIYFARFRSNSESESVHKNRDGDSTKNEQSNVPQSNSFKRVDLNSSYSGPFYITSSLERKPNSHYSHPRSQFSPNSTRHATRRQLSTISATPEPVYDPVQELNAISYQDHEDLESSSPSGSRHSNQGQITHDNNLYQYSNDIPLSPYDLHVEEKMFNKDVIV